MKKINLALLAFAAVVIIFTFNSCKKDEGTTIPNGGGGGDTTTFEADVQLIITTNCSPCHVAGGAQTNYSTYINASNGLTTIIDRTNREASANGFMPNGGTKLSQTELDILAKWKSDGSVEK